MVRSDLQILSACTVELYFHSRFGSYSLWRTLLPVKYIYKSTAPMSPMTSKEI